MDKNSFGHLSSGTFSEDRRTIFNRSKQHTEVLQSPFIHLLVRPRGQGGAEQDGAGPVLLTEDGAVDVMEAVSRDQPDPTGGTAETLRGAEERP